MCTHIVDFQDRKVDTFEGTKASCLIQLVEKHPERRHIAKQHEPMACTGQIQCHQRAWRELGVRTDEVLLGEATARASNGALTVCQAMIVAVLILGNAKKANKT